MDLFKAKNIGLFVSGVLFGTAGVQVLMSDDAKKVYAHTAAAVLRAKDCVMKTVTDIQENAEDILEEAKEINRMRAEETVICEEDDFVEEELESAQEEKAADVEAQA